jgi:hypothetical protein
MRRFQQNLFHHLELYFIFYEFSILKNELSTKGKEKLTGVASSSPHAIAAP